MNKLKQIIEEEIENFLCEWHNDDDFYDLWDIKNEIMWETLHAIKDSKEGDRQPWKLIPFNQLKNVWESFMRYGFVRHEKPVRDIEKILTRNILKLEVNTEIAGHKQYLPTEEMEDVGISEEELKEKIDYIVDPKSGQLRISDYAMEKLFTILDKLRQEKDINKKIPLFDQILNVVHERSDLASWFVEGGSSALSKLSGENY